MKKSKKKQEDKTEQLHDITMGRKIPAELNFELNLRHGIPKMKKSCKIAIGVFAFGAAFFLYNQIAQSAYSNPPAKDPFTSGNVWDDNDNDLQFDDEGIIITDPMTEADRQIITSQMTGLLTQDANSRCPTPVGQIQDVMSICLLPYNLREENNQYNKYYLSILFRDEKASYALNYFTGKDFSSQEESLKDYFADFVNFLNYDCALANCSVMDEAALQVKNDMEGVLHVGKSYAGYAAEGDRYYYIPVYNEDGSVTMYSTWDANIDADDLNPMEELARDQAREESEKLFTNTTLTPSQSLQKVMQILQQSKQSSQEDDLEQ